MIIRLLRWTQTFPENWMLGTIVPSVEMILRNESFTSCLSTGITFSVGWLILL
jgi:hypothetical protein